MLPARGWGKLLHKRQGGSSTNRLRRGVGVEVASDDDIVLPGRIGGGQVGEEFGELLGLFGLNSAFEADT